MYSREEKRQLIQKFWNDFDIYSGGIPELMGARKKWLLYDTKVRGVDLKFGVDRKCAEVILEVSARSERRRLGTFEILKQYKAIIEEGFEPDELIWDFAYQRDNGQQVCRIYLVKYNVDMHRQNQWEEIYEFFADNMLKLQNNFIDIQEILVEKVNALYKR